MFRNFYIFIDITKTMEWEEETFMWHWMEFCELLYPKIIRKNRVAAEVLGLSLLALTHRLYVYRSRPMPCTFFIALIGKPAAGKGRLLDCIKMATENTWIADIPTGSVEAIETTIEDYRFGVLAWDEIGELVEKSGEYLKRVKYLVNRMYYLDRISRYRMSKKSVDIRANSYFVNIIFAGLEEDWGEIENAFLGGFERRFIKLRVNRGTKPFTGEETRTEAWTHLMWLWDYISRHVNQMVFVKFNSDFRKYSEILSTLPERYWSAAEEYTYKLLAACSINAARGVTNSARSISCDGERIKLFPMPQNEIPYSFENIEYYKCEVSQELVDQYQSLITGNSRDFFELKMMRDRTICAVIDRLGTIDSGYLTKTQFVRELLRFTNAARYKTIMEAMEDAGIIRIIPGSLLESEDDIVVYDHTAPLCANCVHFDACVSSGTVTDIKKALFCKKFKLKEKN